MTLDNGFHAERQAEPAFRPMGERRDTITRHDTITRRDRIRGARIDPAITELMNAIDDIDRDLVHRHLSSSPGAPTMHVSTSTQAPSVFVTQYIQTMLWSTLDDDGEPLEDSYGESDLAPATLAEIEKECAEFWLSVQAAGIDLDAELLIDGDATEQAAHDFWLTRNSHGCGFWDGDWSDESEDKLTKLAKSLGEAYPYVGDDGLIYL